MTDNAHQKDDVDQTGEDFLRHLRERPDSKLAAIHIRGFREPVTGIGKLSVERGIWIVDRADGRTVVVRDSEIAAIRLEPTEMKVAAEIDSPASP